MANEKIINLDLLTKYDGKLKTYADNRYAKKEDISKVYKYKGSVPTYEDLPVNVEVGDVYNVGQSLDGANYAWNGTAWDSLGSNIDMSHFVENSHVEYGSDELTNFTEADATIKTEIKPVDNFHEYNPAFESKIKLSTYGCSGSVDSFIEIQNEGYDAGYIKLFAASPVINHDYPQILLERGVKVAGDSFTFNGEDVALKSDIDSIETVGKKGTKTGAEIFNDYVNNITTGTYAHTEGTITTASGDNGSHAEGKETLAKGSTTHAEGYKTKAYANNSHTEGVATTTGSETATNANTASGSHAEGGYTVANAQFAHAEGTYTNAIGTYSHAEGQRTTAKGSGSHAEGVSAIVAPTEEIPTQWDTSKNFSVAIGTGAHAEGRNTLAEGSYAHAEGNKTRGKGQSSHAEGYLTFASANYSHAEGQETKALGTKSHAEGYQTNAEGPSSHAEGEVTWAKGNHSHAEGYKTEATGVDSHAEGQDGLASGKAAHAEGISTQATSDGAHAEGQFTVSADGGTHAEGNRTYALRYTAHSEGSYSVAAGATSHAEGGHYKDFVRDADGNIIRDENNSPTITVYGGWGTYAGGAASHAQGSATSALGINSDSSGFLTKAVGDYSVASGCGEWISLGQIEITEQSGILTLNDTIGLQAGDYVQLSIEGEEFADFRRITSVNENQFTFDYMIDPGTYTVYGSLCNTASGKASFVHGIGLKSSADSQAVFGRYNKVDEDALFIVGNGEDEDTKSNAFEVISTTSGAAIKVGETILTESDINKILNFINAWEVTES